MEYSKNKKIQIAFNINEDLYFKFKTICKAEKKMPAAVLKEFIKNYVDGMGRKIMETKIMETMNEEEVFDGKLWDDVMFDMFSQAKSEEDIAQDLDDIWNDFD